MASTGIDPIAVALPFALGAAGSRKPCNRSVESLLNATEVLQRKCCMVRGRWRFCGELWVAWLLLTEYLQVILLLFFKYIKEEKNECRG